uniref:Saposin B-type domain-containing protein n=1 Tax=Caenorhabditis tropicalis TaxID=1561998 RepID=A0A1I7USU7_9PELO
MWFKIFCFAAIMLSEISAATQCEVLSNTFPECDKCRDHYERALHTANVAIHNFQSGASLYCNTMADRSGCEAAITDIKNVMESLKAELFPQNGDDDALAASRSLVCAHIFGICPEITMEGRCLSEGQWSCYSCTRFLDIIVKVLQAPIQLINQIIPSFFCPTSDKLCLKSFNSSIEIVGVLGDILENEKNSEDVCRNVVKCIA